jgi:hypothetical protein
MPQTAQDEAVRPSDRRSLVVGLLVTIGYLAVSSSAAFAGAWGAAAGRPWAEYVRTISLDSAVYGRALLRPLLGGDSLGRPALSGEAARGQLMNDALWVTCSCLLNAALVWLLVAFLIRRRARQPASRD